jgi:hypothetical protein
MKATVTLWPVVINVFIETVELPLKLTVQFALALDV